MSILTCRVIRSRLSKHYRRNLPASDLWHTNDANNMLDLFCLFLDAIAGHVAPLFTARVQTYANMVGILPQARESHTIAPGPFQFKLFVDQRNFYGHIHGIINARTLGGDRIDEDSVIPSSQDRWLAHDKQKHRTFTDIDGTHSNPPGQDTRVAWSAGCFVFADRDLEELGDRFVAYDYKPGDVVDGVLIEEA